MVRKIFWCFIGCAALWLAGLSWFFLQIPFVQKDPEKADAIVILTGGKGRLEYSLRLLAYGKGKALFISGVGNIQDVDDLLQRMPRDLQERIHVLPASAIELGREAENTIGNAQETARWAKEHAVTSLIVVTSNYHMPRTLLEFSEIMPQIDVTPAPLITEAGYDFRLLLSEYHKYLAAKLRHLIVMWTK